MAQADIRRDTGFKDITWDPSLLLALGTGSALTAFLLVAHSCCSGLTDRHLAPLLQICSLGG